MAYRRFVVHSVVRSARLAAIAGPAALALACGPVVSIDDEGSESSADSTDGSTTATTTAGTTAASSTSSMTTVGTTPTTDPTVDPTSATAADGDTEAVPDCPGTGLGYAMVGEACQWNSVCASAVCRLFTDIPSNQDATCDAMPLDCSMLITATSLDIVTRQPLAGYELRVASALQAATDPVGADAIAEAFSGPDGRLETLTLGPPSEPIGLVALLEGPGFHLTGTTLAAPLDDGTSYGVANDVHDLWLVSNDALEAWSAQLSLDPSIPAELLPLGPNGGVVGFVRDVDGVPKSGATLSSMDAGSSAIVRYLSNDGTFNSIETDYVGLFVVLGPGLAEEFYATVDDTPDFGGARPVITAPNMVFSLAILHAQDGE